MIIKNAMNSEVEKAVNKKADEDETLNK